MADSPPVLDLDTAATTAVGTAKAVTEEARSAKMKVIVSYSNGGEGGSEVRCSTSSSSSSCLDCCSSHGNGSNKEASDFSDLEKGNDKTACTYGGSERCTERREIVAESFDPKAAKPGPGYGNSCSSSFNNEEAKMLLLSGGSNNTTQKVENNLVLSGDDNEDDDDVDSRRRPRPKKAKIPSNAELEDFFSVTENDLMRKFTHRYNFDFVKEEPLEGRYEWVPCCSSKP